MLTALIGNPAPSLRVPAVRFGSGTADEVSLKQYAGRWLVLVFYPRDFSFVCPTELTSLSARIDEFQDQSCDILAISVDTVEDHRRWLDTPIPEGGVGPLQFPLGSDPAGEASKAFGVWQEESHCSGRGLFIIDPSGILQYAVAHNSSVGRNTDETLRVLTALQSGGLCPANWTTADGTIDPEQGLQPGRVLGHYRIEGELGSGTFGTVLSATDLTLNRLVALKVLRRKVSQAKDAVLAEARAAAGLHHPNICTIFAVETIDGLPVIAMEYVAGQPLSSMDLSDVDAVILKSIAVGTARGLLAAHEDGVVHGDLKPANIMLSGKFEAKLLDFGLARQPGNDHRRSDTESPSDIGATVIMNVDNDDRTQISGTPAYMAPEQTYGTAASPASDVFALGLVLAELFGGQRVVTETNPIKVFTELRSEAARERAIDLAPRSFSRLLDGMLDTAPESRPSIQVVLNTLESATFDGAK